MKNFDSNAIGKAAPINSWVSAMEQAFIDTAKGVVEAPQRVHIDRGPNTLLLMPCFGSTYFSTKLVSVFPNNLLKKEIINKDQVIPLWDLIMDKVKVRGETRFFKSVGMAAFDLYGAKLVFESLS